MFRLIKRLPSLQRKLGFILFGFGVITLVYLISDVHEEHLKRKTDVQGKIVKKDVVPGKILQKLTDVAKNINSIKKEDGAVKITSKVDQSKPSTTTKKTPKTEANLPAEGQHPPAALIFSGPKNDEQKKIRDAFLHGWRAYEKYAWGHDELRPISQGYQEWFGLGLTIVDSLDTMYIMGLNAEFKKGREWVATKLKLDQPRRVQLFEVVIRELGGLVSAYYLSGDKVFLDKARDLGDRLLPCFYSGTKIPCRYVNLQTGSSSFVEISTAESGTVQLEFRALSRATGDPKYELAVEGVSNKLHSMKKLDGLVSCFINPALGVFRTGSTVSFGASADSYYEYLLKQWLQTGKTRNVFKDDYIESINGMKKHLLRETQPNKLLFVGAYYSMNAHSFRPDLEHLACFVPGMLAMGSKFGLGGDHLEIAKRIMHTCVMMYFNTPTGLSPEVMGMNIHEGSTKDMNIGYGATYNLQRPETVESLFYLYRITGDKKYREWGWKIFQAFEEHTKLAEGYASVDNVNNKQRPGFRDKMETFYLAETLKYLYLLFEDDPNVLPLDKFVFNTEAHPLPVYKR